MEASIADRTFENQDDKHRRRRRFYIVVWVIVTVKVTSLGQANFINCFSSPPTSLSIPPPQISLLPIPITCTHISMLQRLDIIFTAQQMFVAALKLVKHKY